MFEHDFKYSPSHSGLEEHEIYVDGGAATRRISELTADNR